jgi:hypothetical membrane protein
MAAPLRIGKYSPATSFASGPPSPSTGMQEYMERLVKLIPGEVVGLYLVGVGVIPLNANPRYYAYWAAICLLLVIVVRAYGTSDRVNNVPVEWITVFVSTVSFVLWLYTMQGPLQTFGGFGEPFMGSLAILVWTFVVPYFYKG